MTFNEFRKCLANDMDVRIVIHENKERKIWHSRAESQTVRESGFSVDIDFREVNSVFYSKTHEVLVVELNNNNSSK